MLGCTDLDKKGKRIRRQKGEWGQFSNKETSLKIYLPTHSLFINHPAVSSSNDHYTFIPPPIFPIPNSYSVCFGIPSLKKKPGVNHPHHPLSSLFLLLVNAVSIEAGTEEGSPPPHPMFIVQKSNYLKEQWVSSQQIAHCLHDHK